jgi:iron complex outermembrane receptor protein
MDLTAFTMAFSGYQVNKLIAYPNGLNVIQLTNASKARSAGVELSADAQPSPYLRLTLDAAALDAHFDAFPGGGAAGADATGNRLPFAPRLTFSVGAELVAPTPPRFGRLSLFLRERTRSSAFSGQENTPDEVIPAYQVLDGRLTWRAPDARFELALWARNLADARYLSNRVRDFLGTETVTWGDPRTWGVELTGRF